MKSNKLLFIVMVLLSACNGQSKEKEPSDDYPDKLVLSHESGFYSEPFSLEIKGPKDYDIYYTTDNSDPTEASLLYKEPITIKDVSNNANVYSEIEDISSLDVFFPTELVDKCNLIKVIGINRTTKEKTPISYLNYFVGYQNKIGYANMPVITLDVNDNDLFDYEKGIYVTGKIYDESEHTGYPETWPANYTQKGKEWERPANLKYFDGNKSMVLEQSIGIRIHGGWSRAFNQKSFNLYARKDYDGNSTFNYPFFDGINAHSLMLRSGGYRDTFATKIRDSLNQDFSEEELFDVQRSFPTIVFLNGEYWGIYNLQERYSDNYVQEHHGVNKKNVLIIQNDEIDEGDESDYHYYEELCEFFALNDFTTNEKYNIAKQYIDVDEFASYMSTQLYSGNIDWPGNNVRMYRDISKDSQWHFMMYDTDDSMNMLPHMCGPNIDPFLKSSHWKSGPLEDTCILGLMLSRLIKNQEFKILFRNTFLRIGSENFSFENVNQYLTAKENLLSAPMVNNYHRFVDETYDESTYQAYVETIRSFFEQRYNYAISFLNTHVPE